MLLLRGLLYVRTEFLCADPNALQPLPHHVFRQTLAIADGAIIGTSLKVDGITWNPVDPARARTLMERAREIRASAAVPA